MVAVQLNRRYDIAPRHHFRSPQVARIKSDAGGVLTGAQPWGLGGYTVEEAAEWLGISVRQVRRYMEAGRLEPAARVRTERGVRPVFTMNELMRFDGNRKSKVAR